METNFDRKFLTRPESAEFLNAHGYPATKGTLAKLACVGGGPRYRIFGTRALYQPEDLLSWAQSRLTAPRYSTSEAKGAA